ncbi:MAG: hypothetical protein H7145_23840 [Akkermansiaceae bacterium]|nr:hypothetical protein [Armatimonadota bacterium]
MPFEDSTTKEVLAQTAMVAFKAWFVAAYSRIYASQTHPASNAKNESLLDHLEAATQRMAKEAHIRLGWDGRSPLVGPLTRDEIATVFMNPVTDLLAIATKLNRGVTYTAPLNPEKVAPIDLDAKNNQLSGKVRAERQALARLIDDALARSILPPKQAQALQTRQQGGVIGTPKGRVALMVAKKKLKEFQEQEERFSLLFGTWMDRSDDMPKGEAEPAAIHAVAEKNEMVRGEGATPSQRDQVRHMDVWGTGRVPDSPTALAVWQDALNAFKSGESSQKVLDLLHTVYYYEPTFVMAKVQASAVHYREGKLKQAAQELEEISLTAEGDFAALIKTNLSDYYVALWERSHRQTQSHLDKAMLHAREAMLYPTPARVVNLIIALTKAGKYHEAETALLNALHTDHPNASAEKIVALLHKVQDKDLKKLYIVMNDSK